MTKSQKTETKTTKEPKETKEQKEPKETKTKKPKDDALEKDEQLISIEDFDFSRLRYSDPQKSEIPGGTGFYRRVKVNYLYPDGKIGPPLVQLEKKYCFGVKPDNIDKNGEVMVDKESKLPRPLKGYQASIPMYNKEASDREKMEIEFFDNLKIELKRWAVENKTQIGKKAKKDETIEDSVKDIMYRKQDADGEYVKDYVPVLYSPLIYFYKNKDCQTVFYGPGDKTIDPRTMTSGFHIVPTIRLDSITITEKINLKPQLFDGTVEVRDQKPKKRFAPKNEGVETEGNDDDEVETETEKKEEIESAGELDSDSDSE